MIDDPTTSQHGTGGSPAPARPAARVRSLARRADLVVAATYRRKVAASLDAVWENVFDWEHLPWLHAGAFGALALVEAGDWGWHARIGLARPGEGGPGRRRADERGGEGAGELELELVADRPGRRYVARTLAGIGAGTEIWTRLEPGRGPELDPECDPGRDPERASSVSVTIDFCVPPLPEEARIAVGRSYVGLYTRLWDEDEEMIRTRAAALLRRRERKTAPASGSEAFVDLGSEAELRARLPHDFTLAGERFRIVLRAGALAVDALECPHRFGPLAPCADSPDTLVCAWHGYRFDRHSGRELAGRRLRLARLPRIDVDAATGRVKAQLAVGPRAGAEVA